MVVDVANVGDTTLDRAYLKRRSLPREAPKKLARLGSQLGRRGDTKSPSKSLGRACYVTAYFVIAHKHNASRRCGRRAPDVLPKLFPYLFRKMFQIFLHALFAESFGVEVAALDGDANRRPADGAMTAENQRRVNGFAGHGDFLRLAGIDERVFDDVSVFQQYHAGFGRWGFATEVSVRRCEVTNAASEGFDGQVFVGGSIVVFAGRIDFLRKFCLVSGCVWIHSFLDKIS